MDPRIMGLLALILFVMFIALLGYSVAMYAGASTRLREARARMEKVRHLENLARLRHRNLDAFAKELNILRAKKGKRGVPSATLEKIQFDLTYSIEED